MTWNVILFQNGEPDAWDEHNMGPAGPMKINHLLLVKQVEKACINIITVGLYTVIMLIRNE